jgi:hypothetical protein
VGLAGKPEDPSSFAAFEGEGVEIYVAREICEHLVDGDGRLRVLMPGYGAAWFHFHPPG